jgi:serine phosphatase RsbU (regulator of sigma subunit)
LYDPWSQLTEARRQFLTGFATQAALALQNARQFQVEQDTAETMRHSLLPPAHIEAPKLEIGPYYESLAVDAGRIGGDFYDLFTLPDGRVMACIADVCGKGLKAAVQTALGKYTVRAYAVESPWPARVLARTNTAFSVQDPDSERFTTLAYALLDSDRASLALASAGHPPPILYRAASGRCIALEAGGPALGLVADAEYEEMLEGFEPGDVLLLYTDGILEARSGQEEFGLERIEMALLGAAALSAQEIATTIVTLAREFAGGVFNDDVTLLVLKNPVRQSDWPRKNV